MPELRNVEAVKVLCLEDTGNLRELDRLYPDLKAFLDERGVPYNRERIGLIYDRGADPDRRHFAAALELRGEVNGDGERIVVLLPGGRVACEIHRGGYENVDETYARLEAWLRDQGLRVTGPAREYYLEGFAPTNGEHAVTEIHLPVETGEA